MMNDVTEDPFNDDDEAPKPKMERLTLDVEQVDADFVEAWAMFRNAVYEERRGKRRRRLLTRKSQSERLFRTAVDQLRAQAQEIVRACGPIPPVGADELTLKRYARRFVEWARNSDDSDK